METHTTPATYDQNYAPKSNDGNGVERSLVDVVPLNSNTYWCYITIISTGE